MNATATPEQIVEAARALGKPEFTRKEVAESLGMRGSDLKDAWKAARAAGRLEKVREEGENTTYFRLTDAP